jgi:predicted ArsR family transcriptional regulator
MQARTDQRQEYVDFFKKRKKRLTIVIDFDNIITVDNGFERCGAMKKDLMEIVMNPARQRILQYLIIHGQGSTGEMQQELTDVPPASLYRHVKLLLGGGLIEVMKEERIRGAVEKTYRLKQSQENEMRNQDIGTIFQTGLVSLMTAFQKYFAGKDHDPVKDMLAFSTSTLMMTDEEFLEFLTKLNKVFGEVITNKPKEGRKPRRLTLISSPNEEDAKTRSD